MENHKTENTTSFREDDWDSLNQTIEKEYDLSENTVLDGAEIPEESSLDDVDEYVDHSYSQILNDKITPSSSELADMQENGNDATVETEVYMKENTTDLEQIASLDEMLADITEDLDVDVADVISEDGTMTLEEFDALVGFSDEDSFLGMDSFEETTSFEEPASFEEPTSFEEAASFEEAPIFEEALAEETKEEEVPESREPKLQSDVFSDSLGAVASLEEEALEEQFNSLLPNLDESVEMQKQPSLMKKMFANIEPENAEAEIAAAKEAEQKKEEEKKQKAEEKQKKKEEKQKAAAEKKAAKTAAKDAKAKAKAEAKEKKQKEKEELAKSYVPEGKINKVGASIVAGVAAAAGVAIILGSVKGTHSLTVSSAEFDTTIGRYSRAYESLSGLKLKGSDEKLYNKVKTIMYMEKQQSSYENFKELGMEVEALDSLLKGLERYEEFYEQAKEYGVEAEFNQMKSEVVAELKATYQLAESEANTLMKETDSISYTKALSKICSEK